MSDIHIGDKVKQRGNHNIGVFHNQGPADPQVAFREMISEIQTLRGQVSADDRQVIDESMNTISAGGNVEKQSLRRALGNIAGVATMVGQVGAPVVESIRKVMAAFGM